MSGPIDPDATMPVQGGGAPGAGDPTIANPQTGYPGSGDPTIATPRTGQGGGTTGGGGPGGDWDDDGDRRRLWLIAGGVLALGLLVGALFAVLAGGDDKGDTTTTTSSSTSTSTSTSSTSTSTSTTAVTQPATVQILAFSVTPNPIPDGTCPDGGGGSVNVTVKWGTANTQSVAVGIDGPGPYHPAYSAQTGQDTLPFECGAPGETVQHKYYLTAFAGPNMTGASKQQVITVSGTTPDGP